MKFNARVPDDKLRELVAPGEVLKINRGSWISFFEFRSDEDPHDVDARIKSWLEDLQMRERELREREQRAIYYASVEKCLGNKLGPPALRTRRGKPTLQGYTYIDDDGKEHFVFPEDESETTDLP